jgi:hypothetical protein
MLYLYFRDNQKHKRNWVKIKFKYPCGTVMKENRCFYYCNDCGWVNMKIDLPNSTGTLIFALNWFDYSCYKFNMDVVNYNEV